MAYLNNEGLSYLWGKIKERLNNKVDKEVGKSLISDTEIARLIDVDNYDDTDLKQLIANKVDKESGKGLSTNDYTTAEKNKLAGIATGANKTVVDTKLSSTSTNPVQNKVVYTELENKVDKVSGKGLSTNDYTTTDKNKLESLENYDDTEITSSIESLQKNKVDKESGKGLSTNDYTNAEKTKLAKFSQASDYALKSDITNVYKYKGSVATYAELPTDNLTAGDVYDVQENGMNYAWTGTGWDGLGEVFTIAAITNSEIDAIFEG